MKFAEYQDLLPSEMLETVRNIHAELLAMGFTEEIKEAKSGLFYHTRRTGRPFSTTFIGKAASRCGFMLGE